MTPAGLDQRNEEEHLVWPDSTDSGQAQLGPLGTMCLLKCLLCLVCLGAPVACHSCQQELYNPAITGTIIFSVMEPSWPCAQVWHIKQGLALTVSDTGTKGGERRKSASDSRLLCAFPPPPCPSTASPCRTNLSSACRRSLISYREHMHTTSISQLSTMKSTRQSDIWRKPWSLCAQPRSGSRFPGSIKRLPRSLSRTGSHLIHGNASLLPALCQQVMVPRDYLVVV